MAFIPFSFRRNSWIGRRLLLVWHPSGNLGKWCKLYALRLATDGSCRTAVIIAARGQSPHSSPLVLADGFAPKGRNKPARAGTDRRLVDEARRRSRRASPRVNKQQGRRSRSTVSIRAHVAETETECGLLRSRQTAVVLRRDCLDRRIRLNTHPGRRQRSCYSRRPCPGLICYSPFRAKTCA